MKQHIVRCKTMVLILTFILALLDPIQILAQKQSRTHPEWSKNLIIYEANIRQHSPEGTFRAFETYLPQLKEMGIGIIWLMPIHPIGIKNRKGSLGSYYSVKDYKAVNPEFGTLEDFKSLVNKIHESGMYVIIDRVANHTAWDHPWVTSNPDFYSKDASGNFVPPVPDWSDVVNLNFENRQLWKEMVDAMKYWVAQCEVDGFRCDVAEALLMHLQNPAEFWRPHLVPTLSADNPAYDPKGHYWLGSVWAPTNYMVVKGLEKYRQHSVADKITQNHIQNMVEVYQSFNPKEEKIAFEERYADGYKTIWECYSPEMAAPATRWDNTFYSRQDFVRWSGLSPIAMLIENSVGLDLRGSENTIRWRITREDRHGIKNIQLKEQRVSLICNPSASSLEIDIECQQPFQLEILWRNKQYKREIDTNFGSMLFCVGSFVIPRNPVNS